MHLLPELCTVPSAIRRLADDSESKSSPPAKRTRALDVGAGVGRVTADVLLHLFSDVVLVEPVEPFVLEALRRGRASTLVPADDGVEGDDANAEVAPWKGISEARTSVTFVQATLQDFDPARPSASANCKVLGRVGYAGGEEGELDSGFDVVWCQWCLGALSDADLAGEQVLPSNQPTYVMPLASVLVSASVGLLTFLSYGTGSANTVFNWLANVASVASLQSWAGMLFTYIR